MVLRYLPKAEVERPTASDIRQYAAPLPQDLVFTIVDRAATPVAVLALEDTTRRWSAAASGC
jgi:multisubunit Na+/H+ antiporter MnhC subunit